MPLTPALPIPACAGGEGVRETGEFYNDATPNGVALSKQPFTSRWSEAAPRWFMGKISFPPFHRSRPRERALLNPRAIPPCYPLFPVPVAVLGADLGSWKGLTEGIEVDEKSKEQNS